MSPESFTADAFPHSIHLRVRERAAWWMLDWSWGAAVSATTEVLCGRMEKFQRLRVVVEA